MERTPIKIKEFKIIGMAYLKFRIKLETALSAYVVNDMMIV